MVMRKNDVTTGMTDDAGPDCVLQSESDTFRFAASRTLDENRKLARTGLCDLQGPLICETRESDDLPPRSCFPRNYCRGSMAFGGNREAIAWAVDNCASIVSYVGTGAFLGTVRSILASKHTFLVAWLL